MRILKREKNAVTLKVDNNDDLWVLSHIVKKGDIISGKTTRKIEYESEKERKPVFIKIEVEKVEYAGNLRISGIVINELEDVSKGEHHTFNVEPGSTITIEKEWKKYEVERLMRAVKDTEKPNVLLVAMEPGSAVFGLLSRKGVKIVGEINIDIPGKRYQREQEKRINEFYSKVKATLKQLKDIYNVKHTVIGTLSAHKPTVEKELGAKVVTVSHVGKNALFEMVKQGAIDRVVKEERLKKE
ncbi:MAG TPA: hypothetical protein ENG01_01435, partial [Candidatus Aenigmarchaeota archaeon]|nr:hypothetical protein [Candidatus Aenigmarchaeota archaeon]HEX33059.1 hypothetical protein [Candidatus Aenigmarchaeota archaeon]